MSEIKNIPFSPPDIGSNEIKAVVEVLKSGWITTGPKTKEFESKIAEYVGSKKAVCLNSATSAMELVLRILGVGPGDEVITSAYTYTASASVINHVGAKIVLVDTSPNSFEMDYEKMEKAITNRTKIIIPVDIAGILCDYEKIFHIIEGSRDKFTPNNALQQNAGRIIVLADAAHSFGASVGDLKSGMVADISAFSFHAVKNLTTAEGGAVTWKNSFGLTDEALYKEFMLMSLHGQSKDAFEKTKIGSWEYDVIYPGYKCNMTDINAAIGIQQLKRYDVMLEKRKLLVSEYEKCLSGELVTLQDYDFSSCHLYIVRIKGISEMQRNQVIAYMSDFGISTNVHYKPLPMFTAYKKLGFSIKEFTNAYDYYQNSITLPLYTKLSIVDIRYISEKLIESINKLYV